MRARVQDSVCVESADCRLAAKQLIQTERYRKRFGSFACFGTRGACEVHGEGTGLHMGQTRDERLRAL